ncbi:MAG: hypothetical protein GHHEDOFH_01190 [Pseudorhodoplanes sp.]|nr:hypothetical protein [Pseudorhodoplanes sp.]
MVTKKDFKSVPLAPKGDSIAREVFLNVGYALSQWEHAEEMLASLYSWLCGPKMTHAAFRSYGTLTATGPRRNMLRAAADVFFMTFPSEALSDRLDDLLSVYIEAGARRNEIAHGVVMGGPQPGPLAGQWFLVPALHSTKKNTLQLEAEYRFNSAIIDELAKKFDAFQADIIAYRNDLILHFDSFPEKDREQYA